MVTTGRGRGPARLLLAAFLAVGPGTAGVALAEAAGTVELDAVAMRQLADRAIRAGFAEDALEITDALLARDPQDATALILRAQALRLLGRHAESEAAARAAWEAAETAQGRYGAAMALAQALSLQDRRGEAQIWLRRAVEEAPTPRARARAVDDFGYVRRQNPLKLSFDASLKPSSNVNNGARDATFDYFGIPMTLTGAALALSGLEGAVGVSGSYRLHQDLRTLVQLDFAASHGFVFLSPEARAIAPDAENGDFALTALTGGATARFFTPETRATTTVAGALSHYIWGGEALSSSASLDAGLSLPLAPRTTGRLGLGIERQYTPGFGAELAELREVSLGGDWKLGSGASLSLGLQLGQTTSDDVFLESDSVEVTLGWRAARPVAGLGLSADLALGRKDYPVSGYSFDGRHDAWANLSLSARVERIDYMGFVPVVTVEAGRNRSNIGLYDSQSLGVGLSVASQF